MTNPKELLPQSLTGPRSYFTDLDPRCASYNPIDVIRKLKLQLLTKNKIVIAASYLFHNIGLSLFMTDKGLTECLSQGIIIPAVRSEFRNIEGFFDSDSKKLDGYSSNSKSYFTTHVSQFVTWSLAENTQWFQSVFLQNIQDESSVLRHRIALSAAGAIELSEKIEERIKNHPNDQRYLKREDVEAVAIDFGQQDQSYLTNFSELIYRLSGARAVNSEGHFPQSNLTNLDIAGNDSLLSDDRVFWELYVEAVMSSLSAVARLTPDRLDSLSFIDILKIRQGLFDSMFLDTFDSLLNLVKREAEIHDAERLLLKHEEISSISEALGRKLRDRISFELKGKSIIDKAEGFFQLASVFELLSGGILVGTVGAMKAIPEITSVFSPRLADAIRSRVKIARTIIQRKAGWSPSQKKALLNGYQLLLMYGLPNKK